LSNPLSKGHRARDWLNFISTTYAINSTNKYRQVDDYQYGGGAGMVLMIEPIDTCISQLTSERSYDEIIYLCPDGELLDQGMANSMSLHNNLIMLCGHYKGVDERVRTQFYH
jgi:tRNA (guanine37-N1)-methyltransferase